MNLWKEEEEEEEKSWVEQAWESMDELRYVYMCWCCFVVCCVRVVLKKKELGRGKPSWSLECMRVRWSVWVCVMCCVGCVVVVIAVGEFGFGCVI